MPAQHSGLITCTSLTQAVYACTTQWSHHMHQSHTDGLCLHNTAVSSHAPVSHRRSMSAQHSGLITCTSLTQAVYACTTQRSHHMHQSHTDGLCLHNTAVSSHAPVSHRRSMPAQHSGLITWTSLTQAVYVCTTQRSHHMHQSHTGGLCLHNTAVSSHAPVSHRRSMSAQHSGLITCTSLTQAVYACTTQWSHHMDQSHTDGLCLHNTVVSSHGPVSHRRSMPAQHSGLITCTSLTQAVYVCTTQRSHHMHQSHTGGLCLHNTAVSSHAPVSHRRSMPAQHSGLITWTSLTQTVYACTTQWSHHMHQSHTGGLCLHNTAVSSHAPVSHRRSMSAQHSGLITGTSLTQAVYACTTQRSHHMHQSHTGGLCLHNTAVSSHAPVSHRRSMSAQHNGLITCTSLTQAVYVCTTQWSHHMHQSHTGGLCLHNTMVSSHAPVSHRRSMPAQHNGLITCTSLTQAVYVCTTQWSHHMHQSHTGGLCLHNTAVSSHAPVSHRRSMPAQHSGLITWTSLTQAVYACTTQWSHYMDQSHTDGLCLHNTVVSLHGPVSHRRSMSAQHNGLITCTSLTALGSLVMTNNDHYNHLGILPLR